MIMNYIDFTWRGKKEEYVLFYLVRSLFWPSHFVTVGLFSEVRDQVLHKSDPDSGQFHPDQRLSLLFGVHTLSLFIHVKKRTRYFNSILLSLRPSNALHRSNLLI